MSTVPPPPGPPGPPFQQFARLGLLPDTGRRVDRDDRLYVAHRASAVGHCLLFVRWQRPEDGLIVPQFFRFDTVADRSQQFTVFELGEGTLLGFSLHCSDAALHEASVWAEVGIIRGGADETLRMQALAAGYLDRTDALAWPGGRFERASDAHGRTRAIAGADPAAGAEISVTVPAGAHWQLAALRFALVASAAVANRRVHVVIDDGATTIIETVSQDVQTAGLTRNYNVDAWGFAPPTQDLEIFVPLPLPIELDAGYRIRTVTTALDVADNYGAPELLVEERLVL